jgi:hypothetical protein
MAARSGSELQRRVAAQQSPALPEFRKVSPNPSSFSDWAIFPESVSFSSFLLAPLLSPQISSALDVPSLRVSRSDWATLLIPQLEISLLSAFSSVTETVIPLFSSCAAMFLTSVSVPAIFHWTLNRLPEPSELVCLRLFAALERRRRQRAR